MIALLLVLCVSAASAESSVAVVKSPVAKALSTIADTSMNTYVGQLVSKTNKKMHALKIQFCVQSETCWDRLEYLTQCLSDDLFDKDWIETRIAALLDTVCADDPKCSAKDLEAHGVMSMAIEASARISRVQVEFACAVQTSLHFKKSIVFGDFSHAWVLNGCIFVVLRRNMELCLLFDRRLDDITDAVSLVVGASVDPLPELDGFFDLITSYVRENQVVLYPTEFAVPLNELGHTNPVEPAVSQNVQQLVLKTNKEIQALKIQACMRSVLCWDTLEYLNLCLADDFFDREWIETKIVKRLDRVCAEDALCSASELEARRVVSLAMEVMDAVEFIRFSVYCFLAVALPLTCLHAMYRCTRKPQAPWSRNGVLFRDGKGRYCDGCCAVCLGEDSSIPWTTVTRCEHSFHAECMNELLIRGTTLCPWCSRNMFGDN